MASAREQMNVVKQELDSIRAQIDRLRAQEDVLVSLLSKMSGEEPPAKIQRSRSPSIKPLVLDYVVQKATQGATSSEVDAHVRTCVPTVAKDTVASVLSRLKSDGALVYENERYFEKRFGPAAKTIPDTLWRIN